MTGLKRQSVWLTIVMCWLFYLFSYFVKVEPSVLVDDLIKDFSFSYSQIGLVISVVYIPYVLMQIPCGILTDKIGYKLIISLCCSICALGVFIFGIAQSTFQLMIGRFLIGLSSAPAFLCCGKVAADLFPKEKYGLFMGIAMFLGCVGGVLGTNLSAYLAPIFGWRQFTYGLAFIGIMIGCISYFSIKSNTNQVANNNINILEGLKLLIRNRTVWLLGFYGAMTYLPLSAVAELWGVPFMRHRFNVSNNEASICAALMFVSFGLGSIIAADVAKKLNSYKKTIILFLIGLIITFWFAIYSNSIGFITCVLLFSLGSFFAGANTLSFAMCYDLIPVKYAGTSAGFMNMIVMSSGILFQPLLGKLLDLFRNGKVTSDGVPLYDMNMYRHSFMFIIIGLALALIAVLYIKEQNKQQ